MLIAKLNGQKLTVVSDTVVSDSVKHLTVRFDYSKEWDGYSKTAVFFGSDGSVYSVPMLEGNGMYLGENICYVPSEVIKYSGFEISVFGTTEEGVITSDKVWVEVELSGYCEGEIPAEPTPSEYQQIISSVDKAATDAVAAIQSATESAQRVEAVEEGLTLKMDKFGEVDENGNVNITSNAFKIDQGGCYIQFESGALNFNGSVNTCFKSLVNFEKGLVTDVCNIEDLTAVVNVYMLKQCLSDKENISNKVTAVAEDIVINEPDSYPSTEAVYNFVNEKVGNIETALDSIIALQNSYIGGEAV